MELNNKLTVTRGEGGQENGGEKRKGHQGTCIKDPWTWTMEGRVGWVGWGRVMEGKWEQL